MIATPSKDARLWATIAHLSSFVALSGVVLFGSILGPLVVYLVKKDEDPFIEMHAKEALNFHISIIIYAIIGACLWLGAFFALLAIAIAHAPLNEARPAEPPLWLIPFAFPLGPLLTLFGALVWVGVYMIIAAVTANQGKPFRYPLTIRFIH